MRPFCVTIYGVFFTSPILGCFPFSVWSLIFTPISLIFTQNYITTKFPCGTACAVREWGCWGVVLGVSWEACWRSWIFLLSQMCAWFNLPTRFLITDPSPAPCPAGDWGFELCRSYVSKIFPPQLIFDCLSTPRTCKMCSPIFVAMVQLNCMSMTRAYLTIIPSTEITNGETCFRWSRQCLPCLYFLIVYHQYRITAIGSYL